MSDLIERDKAMDVLDDFQSNVENCVGNAYAIARQQMIDIPSARPKGMTKEIHDINTRALDFVVELIDYIFDYPDDDYMTTECLCRKLLKHGLIDKVDGYYEPKDEQTEREGE